MAQWLLHPLPIGQSIIGSLPCLLWCQIEIVCRHYYKSSSAYKIKTDWYHPGPETPKGYSICNPKEGTDWKKSWTPPPHTFYFFTDAATPTYCIYWKISAYAYFPKRVRHRRLFVNRSLFLNSQLRKMNISGSICPTKMVHLSNFTAFCQGLG